MNQQTHVWPEEPRRSGGNVELAAGVERPQRKRMELWYRLSPEHLPDVTDSANPFLVASLFSAMRDRSDLHIHGRVSPSLLRNLEEFQIAWTSWRPTLYGRIEMRADAESEDDTATANTALLAFSGGLDSCYTAWSHKQGSCGRRNRNVGAGLMVHGFDIPLSEPEVFARAFENSEKILDSIGIGLIPVGCNFRALGDDWEDAHGAAIASCLHLFGRRYACGLIAGSHCYTSLRFPWGSNPLTDPLLGSGTFPTIYDALACSRNEKARAVAEWPEAMSRLRVCWEGKQRDRNCGTCLRCVGTALCFAVERVHQPASLSISSLDAAIKGLNWKKVPPAALARLGEFLSRAQALGITDSWVGVLEAFIRQRQREQRWLGTRVTAATYRLVQWFSR